MSMPLPVDDLEWRIAPTRRPDLRAVMRQHWERLLFLHWEVPAEALAKLLPPGLTLDLFEGRAYVGLVPFTMRGVRPLYLPPFPPLSNFHETNVRTYVHLQGEEPGVWFFSLDAASSVAVKLARAFFRLPYYRADMAITTLASGSTDYTSARRWPPPTPAQLHVRYAPSGQPAAAQPGTLEYFLAERYILYAYEKQTLFQGRVHHTPYPLQTARVEALEEDLLAAAGLARPDVAPLAHYASAVSVDIYPLQRRVDGRWQ